ncbi:hypothetical protein MA16_Dca005876 [Dendrobium catenatum]|uniref:Uncharacterized protein n=1 Tax=Dendrobium catenatum TaxID=906689 RepID=A0A2I0WXF6_9ASPA|nr:hypothetical protein MA16_Dca005876 [Dendrobium catenatum]
MHLEAPAVGPLPLVRSLLFARLCKQDSVAARSPHSIPHITPISRLRPVMRPSLDFNYAFTVSIHPPKATNPHGHVNTTHFHVIHSSPQSSNINDFLYLPSIEELFDFSSRTQPNRRILVGSHGLLRPRESCRPGDLMSIRNVLALAITAIYGAIWRQNHSVQRAPDRRNRLSCGAIWRQNRRIKKRLWNTKKFSPDLFKTLLSLCQEVFFFVYRVALVPDVLVDLDHHCRRGSVGQGRGRSQTAPELPERERVRASSGGRSEQRDRSVRASGGQRPRSLLLLMTPSRAKMCELPRRGEKRQVVRRYGDVVRTTWLRRAGAESRSTVVYLIQMGMLDSKPSRHRIFDPGRKNNC